MALFAIGCGSQNYGGEVQSSPGDSQKRVDAEIKKIEDNPHMPPQAKAAAISALKRAADVGKGAGGKQ